MLAEIYMLRLEAAARAAKDTARFIPITLSSQSGLDHCSRQSSEIRAVPGHSWHWA